MSPSSNAPAPRAGQFLETACDSFRSSAFQRKPGNPQPHYVRNHIVGQCLPCPRKSPQGQGHTHRNSPCDPESAEIIHPAHPKPAEPASLTHFFPQYRLLSMLPGPSASWPILLLPHVGGVAWHACPLLLETVFYKRVATAGIHPLVCCPPPYLRRSKTYFLPHVARECGCWSVIHAPKCYSHVGSRPFCPSLCWYSRWFLPRPPLGVSKRLSGVFDQVGMTRDQSNQSASKTHFDYIYIFFPFLLLQFWPHNPTALL